MSREEVIKTIGITIEDGLERHDLLYDIAEALLALCWPCRKCDGKGSVYSKNGLANDPDDCPSCRGTGFSDKKMLGILSEDQTSPENREVRIEIQRSLWLHNERALVKDVYFQGQMDKQQDMITPKDGYVWRKVRV